MNSDRFKFRVWDAWKKKYRYDLLVGMDGYLYEWGNFQSVETEDKKRFTIEQSTGLRDKNGKLIYEGDILGDDQPLEITVVWVNVYWGYYADGGFHALPYWVNKLEIIGNIHETEVKNA